LAGKERVSPEVYQAALLDEIAERLLQIQKLYEEEKPEGVVEPIEKFRITEARTPIKLRKAWFSVSIINDDDANSVFVIVNTEKSFEEHEVKEHETYNIDMHRAVITDLLCWCNHGETATIRIVGVR
jgi:c-di-GMP-related signal transduction protein